MVALLSSFCPDCSSSSGSRYSDVLKIKGGGKVLFLLWVDREGARINCGLKQFFLENVFWEYVCSRCGQRK
jgi:hypothetical protein